MPRHVYPKQDESHLPPRLPDGTRRALTDEQEKAARAKYYRDHAEIMGGWKYIQKFWMRQGGK